MAEIKSTMELVMEKLARLGTDTGNELDSEEKIKDGMRLGARFLEGEIQGLDQALNDCPAEDRTLVQKGITRTMLRNIMLPREDDQQRDCERAMHGLLEMTQGTTQMIDICTDMKHTLDRFLAHKDQYRTQLEQAFLSQLGQMEDSISDQTGMAVKLDPSQHPQFQQEWDKVMTSLNEQYGNALEQQKDMVEQVLAGL